MKKLLLFGILMFNLVPFTPSVAGEPQPKYGPKGSPKAIPLAVSNEYFRESNHKAPAFWSLISFYIPQSGGASCATATLTMTLNAARAHMKKMASDAVITEKTLWENVDAGLWKNHPNEPKYQGTSHGISLDQLGRIAEAAFKKYGFPNVKLQIIHTRDKSASTRTDVIKHLKSLSDKTFIMANFQQKAYTDDADIGHVAPVGAYDEKRGRVLILDPDRGSPSIDGYYEPYWVSVDTFLAGLATLDSSERNYRGYIVVRL